MSKLPVYRLILDQSSGAVSGLKFPSEGSSKNIALAVIPISEDFNWNLPTYYFPAIVNGKNESFDLVAYKNCLTFKDHRLHKKIKYEPLVDNSLKYIGQYPNFMRPFDDFAVLQIISDPNEPFLINEKYGIDLKGLICTENVERKIVE